MKRKPRRKQYHRMMFLIAPRQPMISFRLPVDNAKSPVELTRLDVDAINGTPGQAATCMNSQCALRQTDKFPHPAFYVQFIDSRAFIVDKMRNGQPAHCVRYALSQTDTREIKLYDTAGGKEKMLRLGLVVKTLRLLVPPREAPGQRQHGTSEKSTHVASRKVVPIRTGAYGRALRTGLVSAGV